MDSSICLSCSSAAAQRIVLARAGASNSATRPIVSPRTARVRDTSHREFAEEEERLALVVAAIEDAARKIDTAEPRAMSRVAQAGISQLRELRKSDLERAAPEPYFGRLHFVGHDLKYGDTYYIGRVGFQDGSIFVMNWESPMARLFYVGGPGFAEYEAPGGLVSGELVLKRHLDVDHGTLYRVSDAFDRRGAVQLVADHALQVKARGASRDPFKPAPKNSDNTEKSGLSRRERARLRRALEQGEVVEAHMSDEFLGQVLAGRAAATLTDITATIQAEQYNLISAAAEGALIVQGVAGSGKTSIALQRLAWLLYPGNSDGIKKEQCVIFAPSRMFLFHIRSVLPGLGVDDIRQAPLMEWAADELGVAKRVRTDAALDAILDPSLSRAEKDRIRRAAIARNVPGMALVLEGLAGESDPVRAAPAEDFTVTFPGFVPLTVTLPAADIANVVSAASSRSNADARQDVLERVVIELVRAHRDELTEKLKEFEAERSRLESRAHELEAVAESLGRAVIQSDFVRVRNLLGERAVSAPVPDDEVEMIGLGLRQVARGYADAGRRVALRVDRIRGDYTSDSGGERGSVAAVRSHATAAVSQWLSSWWGRVDAIREYRRLFTEPGCLARLSDGLLDPRQVEDMLAVTFDPKAIDLSELPGMHLLQTLITRPPATFSHIILDEAQDVSPLHFEVLRRRSKNGSFTVVGDANQGLFAHRGLPSWAEAAEALGAARAQVFRITRSYRNSSEITTFANGILTAGKVARPALADPFPRSAGDVRVTAAATEAARVATVVHEVNASVGEGFSNIAVLCHDVAGCGPLADELAQFVTEPAVLAPGPDFEYGGGIVVMPIAWAKGLEFEAVVLSDASQSVYPSGEFEHKLLYVAATRALHRLSVVGLAPLADAIVSAAARGESIPEQQSP